MSHKKQVADLIGKDAVDFLGRRPVETSQAAWAYRTIERNRPGPHF